MRVNPAQINAYTRKIDRPLNQTGAVLDVTTARGSAPVARPLPGHRIEEGGAIQGVLTPEESRFIAALFPQGWGRDLNGSDRLGRAVERDGQERLAGWLTGALGRVVADAKVGQVYTHAGRPMPGSIPGLRLDLKG